MGQVRQKEKVVCMPSQLEITYQRPAPPGPVTQEDLAIIIALQLERDRVQKALDEKIRQVRCALEHGAHVEGGVRSAQLRHNLIIA
jgi:hypothetical protein